MKWRRTEGGYLLRLFPGEEVVESLLLFLGRHSVASGALSGIGALGEVELGFFRRHERTYTRQVMNGEWELLSLAGNACRKEGEPFIHAHVVLGDENLRAIGGHLFRGVVSATVEIVIHAWTTAIERSRDPDLGLFLLELDGEAQSAPVSEA